MTVEPNQLPALPNIYMKYFGYKTDGFFVDVGAYDGMSYSNSYCLAEAGWKGICYEPIPEFYQKCIEVHRKHPNVKIIQTALGNRTGVVNMVVAGTLSTYSDYYINTKYWGPEYRWKNGMISPITTLDITLRENNVQPNFDVLSLDVEGSETDVLKCFDVEYWKPKMAIIEAQENHPADELRNQAPFINMYFEEAGYEKIYSDEVNNIYVI